jgi:REP element-mobilizing transposase RayT
MARPIRIEFEGAVYHVASRGNERRKIFFSKKDYDKFKEYVGEAKEKYRFILHGYVLMTNHYHLLIETPEKNLSKIMHHINSSYTSYTNVKRKRSGHLFQGRFKAILVDKDSYLLELSRYLHLNPVRAKIAERPEDYPYSSYKTYILSQGETLVTRSTILEMFTTKEAESRTRYKSFVEASLGEDVESPLKKVYGGMILGGERFIKDVLGKVAEEQLEKEAVSHRKALRAPYGAEEVLQAVCKHYGILREEITSAGGGEVRKICLYLLKKHTIAHTREIGDLLNMSYAAAAKMYQRFAKELAKDEDLRRVVAGVGKKLSYVEG